MTLTGRTMAQARVHASFHTWTSLRCERTGAVVKKVDKKIRAALPYSTDHECCRQCRDLPQNPIAIQGQGQGQKHHSAAQTRAQ